MKNKYLLILLIFLISTSFMACSSVKDGFEDGLEGSKTEYTIGIEIEFYEHASGNVHMGVVGKTDLPDGEEILISVVSEENDFIATSKDIVTDGVYMSEPFSHQGESLPSGKYKITVSTAKGDKATYEKVFNID